MRKLGDRGFFSAFARAGGLTNSMMEQLQRQQETKNQQKSVLLDKHHLESHERVRIQTRSAAINLCMLRRVVPSSAT